jgi:hypothetical protein
MNMAYTGKKDETGMVTWHRRDTSIKGVMMGTEEHPHFVGFREGLKIYGQKKVKRVKL